jgi:hypothetical protein
MFNFICSFTISSFTIFIREALFGITSQQKIDLFDKVRLWTQSDFVCYFMIHKNGAPDKIEFIS